MMVLRRRQYYRASSRETHRTVHEAQGKSTNSGDFVGKVHLEVGEEVCWQPYESYLCDYVESCYDEPTGGLRRYQRSDIGCWF